MSKSQDVRFTALCAEHDAVAATPLPDGAIVYTARTKTGKIAAVELVLPDGQVLGHDETVRRLGAVRQVSLLVAEQATTALVEHLALRAADPNVEDPNLAEAHRLSGVARQTLYNRLDEVDVVKPKRHAKPAAA